MASTPLITREILASTTDDDLELLFTNYVFELQKSDPNRLDSLPIAIQAAFIVAGLDADVLNGGFNQYLFNSPDFAQDAPDALRVFELQDAAALAQQALEYFEADVKERHAVAKALGTVEAFMATYEDNALSKFDEAYYAGADRWRAQRVAYIRQHPDEFVDL